MPYISEEDRKHIDVHLNDFWDSWVRHLMEENLDPELNYSNCGLRLKDISKIIREVPSGKVKGAFNYFVTRLWLNTFFPNGEGIGYTSLSDAIAVFVDMEDEMRRRLMQPYEDQAINKNGDLPEMIQINEKHKFVKL